MPGLTPKTNTETQMRRCSRNPRHLGRIARAAEPVVFSPAVFYLFSLAIAFAAALLLRTADTNSLSVLSNFMGPLAERLAHGGSYLVSTDAMQTAGNVIAFRANRMPLPPLLLALLIRIFGDRYLWVELAKIALVLVPVAAAYGIAQKSLPDTSSLRTRILVAALLFGALVLPTQLIDVVNMQVEEGYSFCLLTYAVAILLFGVKERTAPWRTAVLFALSVVGLYLTKSSMIAAALFLVAAFCLKVRSARKRTAVLLIALCGPLGWGLYTFRATGDFSSGTSIDGINLHKGNYALFLDRYPPADGESMDRYDQALSNGKVFSNEWSFNAYHMSAAEDYMRAHPERTIRASLVKAEVFFVSLRKIGSQQYSGWLGTLTDISMLLFRLLLWSACGLACWLVFRGSQNARWPAVVSLGTVLAVSAPYLAGFALTRHAGVLILPSALFLCWWTIHRPDLQRV